MSAQSFSLLVEMRDKITAPLKGIRSPLKQFSAGVTGAKQNLKQLNSAGRELNFAEKATASLEKLTPKMDDQRKKLAELQGKLAATNKTLANGDNNLAYDKLQKRIDNKVAAIETLEAKETQYHTQLSATRKKLQDVGIETTDLKRAREQLTQRTDTARAADVKYKQTLQGIKSLAPSVGRSLSGLKVTALATATSIGGIGYGMTRLTGDLAKTAKDLTAVSEAFNISTDKLQIWQNAGTSVSDDLGSDKIKDLFKDVQDKVGDFALTGGGEAKDLFETLKLDIKEFKNLQPDKIFLKIGNALDKSKLTQSQKIFLLEGLANDASLLLPLLKDNAKVLRDMGALSKDANALLSKKDIEILTQAKKQTSKLGIYWKGAKQQFGVAIADIWVKSGVNVILKDWLRMGVAFAKWKMSTHEFQSFIRELPGKLSAGATKAMELAREITGFIGEVKEAVLYVKDLAGGWQNLLIGFVALRSAGTIVALGKITGGLFGIMGGAKAARAGLGFVGKGLLIVKTGLLAASRAMLLNPIGLLVTAIAGGGYLIYKHWDKITQSFKDFRQKIGDMSWPDIGIAVVKTLITLPPKLLGIGGDVVKGLVGGIVQADQYLWNVASNLVNGFVGWVEDLLGIRSPSRVFSEIGGYIIDGMITGILGAKDALFTAVGNILDTLKAKASELINDVLAIPSQIKQGIRDLKSKAVDIAVNLKDGAIQRGRAATQAISNSYSQVKSYITGDTTNNSVRNAYTNNTHQKTKVYQAPKQDAPWLKSLKKQIESLQTHSKSKAITSKPQYPTSRHTMEQVIKERKAQRAEPTTVGGEITVKIEAPKGYSASARVKKSPAQNVGLTANVGKASW